MSVFKTSPASSTSSGVFYPRLALSLLLGSMICLPRLYQPLLTTLYTILLHSSFYRSSTFETWWTVLVYTIIEVTYTYRFGHNPHLRLAVKNAAADSGTEYKHEHEQQQQQHMQQQDWNLAKPLPKMQRPQYRLKEGLLYIAPLLLLDLTMIKKFAGVSTREIAISGNYDPAVVEVNGNFLTPTLHRFTLDSPLQTRRALPPAAPTSRMLVFQLITSIFIYDTVFFWFHFALHKVPFLKKVHALHHNHPEIHPQITNRLDVIERLGLVLLANFSLNIIGSHVFTRTLFVPLFVWLLVDIHSGLDLDWSYDKLLPEGWASGSRRHSYHHRHGTKYYEPFLNWWDDAIERFG